MADVPVPGYQAFWIDKGKSLKTEYKRVLSQSPDADEQLKQLFKVLCDIEDLAGYTLASVGDSDQWSSIVNTAEENRQNFCKALGGKTVKCPVWHVHSSSARAKGLTESKHHSRPDSDTEARFHPIEWFR
jgi:hypothetical protein